MTAAATHVAVAQLSSRGRLAARSAVFLTDPGNSDRPPWAAGVGGSRDDCLESGVEGVKETGGRRCYRNQRSFGQHRENPKEKFLMDDLGRRGIWRNNP